MRHPQLEGQEAHELCQRHDIVVGPAGLLEMTNRGRGGVLRVEGQQVGEVKGGGEARGAVEKHKAAVDVGTGGDAALHRAGHFFGEFLRFLRQQVGIELHRLRSLVNASNKGRDGVALRIAERTGLCRLEERGEGGLCVVLCFGAALAQLGDVPLDARQ